MMKFIIYCLLLLLTNKLSSNEFSVIFTASLNGEVMGCFCKSKPRPGLSKVSSIIKNLRNENKESVLIDSGDILPSNPNIQLTNLIISIYKSLKYDAVGIGDIEIINNILKQKNKMFISSNIENYNNKHKIITKGKIKIGIFSLIMPRSLIYSKEHANNIKIIEPEFQIAGEIEHLKKEGCKYIVLLSHLDIYDTKKIAEEYKEINLIIMGHEGYFFEQPLRINNTYIVACGLNGNKVGHLIIKEEGSTFNLKQEIHNVTYNNTNNDKDILKMITNYKNKIKQKNKKILGLF